MTSLLNGRRPGGVTRDDRLKGTHPRLNLATIPKTQGSLEAGRWPDIPGAGSAALLTMCYTACMSVNVSVRLDDMLAERLRLRARAAGESLSDRLRRYADEGARRDEHPLITFRDGPAGRRAAVTGGPDVWEIIMWLEDLSEEGDPATVLTAEQDISRPLIDAAVRYREAYPDEIEARIALHRHDTAAADAQ